MGCLVALKATVAAEVVATMEEINDTIKMYKFKMLSCTDQN